MMIDLWKWNEDDLDRIIRESSRIAGAGKRIDVLSRHFLGTRYAASTLKGSKSTNEELVINLREVDCFTFLDYVEAMRRSGSFTEFTEHLICVRYRSGQVTFSSRNHFFTDWPENSHGYILDITGHAGGSAVRTVEKTLNLKSDGTLFLPGLRLRERQVSYIPTAAVDDSVIQRLKTGDYVGIYSDKKGLDVSHVGIFIRTGDTPPLLRHASSHRQILKVTDQEFRDYIAGKPGLIIFRPKDSAPIPHPAKTWNSHE